MAFFSLGISERGKYGGGHGTLNDLVNAEDGRAGHISHDNIDDGNRHDKEETNEADYGDDTGDPFNYFFK